MKKKNIVILGSTGSIGENTLDIVRRYPQKFSVLALTAYDNDELLKKQIKEFRPRYAAVGESRCGALRTALKRQKVEILSAQKDLSHIAALPAADVVVIGMSGSAALEPFLAAVRGGKRVAPANKEALVIAGEIIMREARKHKAEIIPVDSEQSAVFQCLEGHNRRELKKIYLTASGGPLLNTPVSRFAKLSTADILKHPRWNMGRKITVDSATLMNKGFEVIEAKRLFGLADDQIEVVIHPEAIIHSMVSFRDASIIAQLGVTDMRIPIQYALTYPERWDTDLPDVDFVKLGRLHFEKPDFRKFPALALAFEAARQGGTLPAVLNAADEIAVGAFLAGKIRFVDIYPLVEKVTARHRVQPARLEKILEADRWAREEAARQMARGAKKKEF